MADSLVQLGTQLTRAILPIIIIVGVVGNSFNIGILTRPSLFHHACSRYFLALATNNLFYSGIIFTYRLFANGYQLNLSNNSIILCKMITYISTIGSFLSPYFIVFASIDRYCSSSRNAQIRKFSCIRMAQWMIFIVIVVFSFIFINILVMVDLNESSGFICVLQVNSLYGKVYLFIQVFLFAVVPPSLMTLFGLLTIHNTKQLRVIPVAASHYNRTERQLARMLFLQVSSHIFLTLPTSVIYLVSALPNTIQTTTIFSFLSTIFQLLFYCSYVTPFFLYLLSGRIYRKELIRLIYSKFRIRCGNQVQPSVDEHTAVPMTSAIPLRPLASRY